MKKIYLYCIMITAAVALSSCNNSDQFSELNYEKAMAIAKATLALPVDSVVFGAIGGNKLVIVRAVDTASFKFIKDNELKILDYSNESWKEVKIHYSHEDEGDIERGAIADISLIKIDGQDYIYYSIDSPDFYGHDGGRKDYVLMTYPELKPLALSFVTTEDGQVEVINPKNKNAFPKLIAFLEEKNNNLKEQP